MLLADESCSGWCTSPVGKARWPRPSDGPCFLSAVIDSNRFFAVRKWKTFVLFFFAAETLNVRSVGTCEFCFLKKNFRVKFIFFLKKKPTERYCAVRLICGVFIFTSEMQRLFWGLFCYANSVASIRIVGRPYLRGRRRRRDPERVGTVSPAAEKGRRLPGHENK